MELIHQQPVRWTNEKVISCDGGGGPLGHPRVFINVDKPQINWCTYCGLPFVRSSVMITSCDNVAFSTNSLQAHHHHRKFLESQPSTAFPLDPTGHPAELPGSHVTGKTGSTEPYQTNTGKPLEQR